MKKLKGTIVADDKGGLTHLAQSYIAASVTLQDGLEYRLRLWNSGRAVLEVWSKEEYTGNDRSRAIRRLLRTESLEVRES